MDKKRLILFTAEMLVLITLRVLYVRNRAKVLPRGAAVTDVKGRRVLRLPFTSSQPPPAPENPIWVPPKAAP